MDDDEVLPAELLDEDFRWLFRGMFLRSPDDLWMKGEETVEPQDRTKKGRYFRDQHTKNGLTDSAYTSWTTIRDTAQMFAEEARDDADGRGEVVVFKVWIPSLTNRCFRGSFENENEILIEGTVEDVVISYDDEEDEHDA
jgi:hypothetical protein